MLRDIGANLTNSQFAHDLPEVIQRAKNSGIAFIDITGTSVKSSKIAISIAEKDPSFFGCTAGIHPHATKDATSADLQELEKLFDNSSVLMCGEMGLDFARTYSPAKTQHFFFEAQLNLAKSMTKPLFLHCRDAHDEFIKTLDKFPDLWSRAIIHCFTGSSKEADAYLERGAFLGITGWLADKRRNTNLLHALEGIPLEKILLETDAPYLTPLNKPKSQLKDRNEPSYLLWVAKLLAQIKGTSLQEVCLATTTNADKLIGKAAPSKVKNSPRP